VSVGLQPIVVAKHQRLPTPLNGVCGDRQGETGLPAAARYAAAGTVAEPIAVALSAITRKLEVRNMTVSFG